MAGGVSHVSVSRVWEEVGTRGRGARGGGGQVPIFTCELHVVSMPNMNQVFVSIKNSFCHYITHK